MRRFKVIGAILTFLIVGILFAYWYGGRRVESPNSATSNEPTRGPGPIQEPVYQSKAPKYCLLAFGPKAKHRVWLVFDAVPNPLQPGHDKNYLYVDRNGNGDLTEEGERVEAAVLEQESHHTLGGVRPSTVPLLEFAVGDITDNTGLTYKDLTVQVRWFVGLTRPCEITVTSPGRGPQRSDLQALVFADGPARAPLLQFGGPLTIRFALGIVPSLSLSEPTDLGIEFGTPGQGEKTFVSLVLTSFPKNLSPVAKVEFPHREIGKPPIEVTVLLTERC